MITIQPEIEILSTESYEDMLRRIEKIGRVCYKSEERIGRRHCRNSSQASSNAAMNPSLSTAPSP